MTVEEKDGAIVGLIATLEHASNAQARFEIMYSTLRDRISMLVYHPGMRLSEEALAAEFGVSRSPLRKALKILEADGLLRSAHGVGTIVTDVDIDKLGQVYQLRMELNELVGKLMPRTPDRDVQSLFETMRRRAEDLQREPSLDGFARLNIDFFHAFQSLTENEPLKEVSEKLFYQTCRIWLTLVPADNLANEVAVFCSEVIGIVNAVRIGDIKAAALLRRAHLSMGYTRLQDYARTGV
ncbi:GntR family transcriptional regulator [Rhizobium sp. L1K21]|uniref:GntR family transcriptional regulator n=1 Tax=Rhizobium sp. L1K21 TaxID=2954933 RepID=UPI00209362F9|nr:GntR family transcriptional regulator [Rhizobium sp. L1K21]MCO6185286.1 GntR family transcriptional regulator [Rhizobium sp. L1K21]